MSEQTRRRIRAGNGCSYLGRKPGEAASRTNDVALKAALHLTRSSALWGGI